MVHVCARCRVPLSNIPTTYSSTFKAIVEVDYWLQAK